MLVLHDLKTFQIANAMDFYLFHLYSPVLFDYPEEEKKTYSSIENIKINTQRTTNEFEQFNGLAFIGVQCFSKPLYVLGNVDVNDGKEHFIPENFSTLCNGRIEVRRGTLDILRLHSLDLEKKKFNLGKIRVFDVSHRSEIESCNFDRQSFFLSEV